MERSPTYTATVDRRKKEKAFLGGAIARSALAVVSLVLGMESSAAVGTAEVA